MQLAMIQDKIIPLDELDPAYTDRGTYFGDGVYEVLRSYAGRLFALEDHLERLQNSLTETQITGISIDSVRQRVLTAFEAADMPEAKIYFHITRGLQLRDHLPTEDLPPNFVLTVTKIPDFSADKLTGVKVCTAPDLRWKRCDIKSLNLLPNILARMEARKKGCIEAILVNDQGLITEGAGSTLFSVFADTKQLFTHPLGPAILPSITRKHVIQIAPKADLTVIEEPITPARAAQADELFIAATTKDVMPVIQFDDTKIADTAPGPYTKKLMETFKNHVHNKT
jgi:D-alanine transaminase